MGLSAEIRRRMHIDRSGNANQAFIYRIYLVRAAELGWIGGTPGRISGLSEKGISRLIELAANLQSTHPPETFRVFSVGGFNRQEFSANIIARTLGVYPEHLKRATFTSDFRLGQGDLARTLRDRAERGMQFGVIVAAEPTIRHFLGLPNGSVQEGSVHHFDVRSPRRAALITVIK